ncbi:MAG: hypothetical protein HYV27_16875 [Candidatus Hydrogenedentes bacterium]|nr:hypothetical protein [Candidatus Hydrogenedentota bacterium]
MSGVAPEPQTPARIVCVDQLRGYAIFGMLLVNANGIFFAPIRESFNGSAWQGLFDAFLYQINHHQSTFTYADTIAPLFVFVVGMGMRLSWLRQAQSLAPGAIRKAFLKRYAVMVLIAFAIYPGWLWDALMDIGLAGIIAIPLIDKSARVRIAAAAALLLAYQAMFTFTSYGVWLREGAFSLEDPGYVPLLVRLLPLQDYLFGARLNGGPLGPLSWVTMLLFGSCAYDWMAARKEGSFVFRCVAWGAGLCALAWAFHAAWPGLKPAWPISAHYMTIPFPLWATGLCFLHVLGFYVLCDKLRVVIPTFTPVGMNPLALYIVQSLFLGVLEEFSPARFSFVAGVLGFAAFWGVFSGAAWFLHRRRIYIKL